MPPKIKALRINPPRRRESERMKTRSASAATTPTTATSVSSAGDTIEVAQKSSDDRVESMTDTSAVSGEKAPLKVGEKPNDAEPQAEEPVQATGGGDQEMEHAHDKVTEYDFSNEDSGFDEDEDVNPRGIFKDTVHDVIEISSDDGVPQDNFALDPRPWRSMNRAERKEREKMYCEQLARPIDGDWERAESYQENVDQEMEEYIKDHKLQDWVIGVQRAQRGFDRMIDRKKYRGFGVPIFQEQILRQLGMQPAMGPPMQPPPLPPPGHHRSHAPPGRGHPQMPQQIPHHNIAQHFPPPHNMPYAPPGGQMAPPVVYQPMQQVGVDVHGNPVYQPVQQPPPQPNPLAMPPPKRTSSHPHAPQKRASASNMVPGTVPLPEQARRKRQRRDSQVTPAANVSSFGASSVPPYPAREGSSANTTSIRRDYKLNSLEPGVLPWNRDMDFRTAAKNARWNEAIYTPLTLDLMQLTREKNRDVVARYDAMDDEKSRQAKREGSAHVRTERQRKEPDSSEVGANGGPVTPDAHGYDYATDADKYKARALAKALDIGLPSKPTVEDFMATGQPGDINKDRLDGINIRWNPAKKGVTELLQQVVFSIRDSLRTRDQLKQTPILTNRAAECLIDFCPDLLCHDTLLRITSETSMGPMKVRYRMCLNGNYVDKATITKRVGTALGKNQQVKGIDEETAAARTALYKKNKADYGDYQLFFGKSSRKSGATQPGMADSSAVGSRSNSRGSDGDVVVLDSSPERMATRSSMNKGKGEAKDIEIIQIDGADDEADESRPSSRSSSEAGVVVVPRDRAPGKRKIKPASRIMQLDGAADEEEVEEDEDEEMDVVADAKELDEVSLQSDGELDRLVDDSD